MDKTDTTTDTTTDRGAAEQQSKAGQDSSAKQGGKQSNYQGPSKTGRKLDRKVAKRKDLPQYTPLRVTYVQTEIPLEVTVYTDFGATALNDFMPAYDDNVSFLYEYVQSKMKPLTEGKERAARLGSLIEHHQRFSFNLEQIDGRAASLERKLADTGLDIQAELDRKAATRTIYITNPHLLSYYEAVHKADRLIVLLDMAWVAGKVTVEESKNDFWGLKRSMEREFNFIDKVATACRTRSRWDPFPMFIPVENRMKKEQEKAEKERAEQSETQSASKSEKAEESDTPKAAPDVEKPSDTKGSARDESEGSDDDLSEDDVMAALGS